MTRLQTVGPIYFADIIQYTAVGRKHDHRVEVSKN